MPAESLRRPIDRRTAGRGCRPPGAAKRLSRLVGQPDLEPRHESLLKERGSRRILLCIICRRHKPDRPNGRIKQHPFCKSPGQFEEFVRAVKGGPAAVSNFPDYAGRLTETILLGNLAVWTADTAEVAGKKIEWDPQKLVATNAPEVEPLIRPTPRDGWKV